MNSHKNVKIRKQHECFSCYRKFYKGTVMQKWACVYQGDFNHGYTCMTCEQLHSLSGENEFEAGYVHEWKDNDQTPEKLLERLLKEKNFNY